MVDTSWTAAATLIDGVRRALYEYVRARRDPVTRDEAAAAVGVSRKLAAFHLDKLVDAGLLVPGYASRAARPRGPGRTPKVYRPSAFQFCLTIPERRFELLGEILVEAVAQGAGDAPGAALAAARRRGMEIGRAAGGGGEVPGPLRSLLARLGFEPAERDGAPEGADPADPAAPSGEGPGIVLRNCPFHQLAVREPELVCGINHAFLDGLLSGLGADGYRAALVPGADRCCVLVTASRPG